MAMFARGGLSISSQTPPPTSKDSVFREDSLQIIRNMNHPCNSYTLDAVLESVGEQNSRKKKRDAAKVDAASLTHK